MIKKRSIPLLAMIIALTVTLSLMFIIPVPYTKGFVTLADVGIYVTALLFGGSSAALVGAVSGGLIDTISGYPHWILFSIIIHGFQGYVCGKIGHNKNSKQTILALLAGSVVMITEYFIAGGLMYGFHASALSIFGNIIQNIFGIMVSLPVVTALKRINPVALRHKN